MCTEAPEGESSRRRPWRRALVASSETTSSMLSLSSPRFQPDRVPAVKLRALWMEEAAGGSTNVALAPASSPGRRRSRAASGHQPTGGHQSKEVHRPRGSVDCTEIILRHLSCRCKSECTCISPVHPLPFALYRWISVERGDLSTAHDLSAVK